MNHEDVYEKVMGHKPVTDGQKGSFGWDDIKRLMEESQRQVDDVCCQGCGSKDILLGINKTEVDPNCDGTYREIVFDLCRECGYAIDVDFFD